MEQRDILIFDGVNSEDYDIYIMDAKLNNGVERDYDAISVPGRNGELHIDNGRYNNVLVPYTCSIVNEADTLLQGYLAQLYSRTGYKRLEDSIHPEYYRQAAFVSNVEPTMFDWRNKGIFELTFNCKPQKFLKSGEKVVTLARSNVIHNPTLFDSRPLFKVTGTGTITVNNITITISTNPGDMVIDCDMEDAYGSNTGNNYNGYITLSMNQFPKLKSGNNSITTSSGITASITPRWWTV